MQEEIWKDVKGYEGKYKISNYGRVKSLKRKKVLNTRILKGNVNGRGYLIFALLTTNLKKYCKSHRLVAKAFIPNLENKPDINHIDGNKLNNYTANLEWCTHTENIRHAHKLKLYNRKGTMNNQSKLTEKQVLRIRALYKSGDFNQYGIASMFNIKQGNVSDIVLRKLWKHI